MLFAPPPLKALGAKKTVFVDALKPFLAAALARFILHEEVLGLPLVAGTLLTTAGVLLVALEKSAGDAEPARDAVIDEVELQEVQSLVVGEDAAQGDGSEPSASTVANSQRTQRVGWLCAIANVTLDCYGAVLTKQHASELSTWEINAMRFGSSGAFLLVVCLSARLWAMARRAGSHATAAEWARLVPSGQSRHDWLRVSAGTLMTTFCAPALGAYALFLISLPAHACLTSLGPLYALPIGFALRGDPITRRALLGAALAVLGVVTLAIGGPR